MKIRQLVQNNEEGNTTKHVVPRTKIKLQTGGQLYQIIKLLIHLP